MRAMKDCGVEWIGEIPEEWETIKYKYVVLVQSGFPFDSAKFSLDSGFPLIRIRDITSGQIETYFNGDFDEHYIVHAGDCIIGMDGDFNIRWWNNSDALLNQRCCRIEVKDGLIKRYAFYSLPYELKIINELVYSTTVKHLSSDDIKNARLPLPTVEEQIHIAEYLDAKCAQIDAIIEKQQQVIEKLKAYKQSVITEAVTKGLDPTVPMKDSGVEWIGMIPESWNVGRVGMFSEFFNGDRSSKYPKPEDFVDNGVPFINSTNIEDDEVDTSICKYISHRKYSELGGAKIQPFDIIFCLRGSVGKVAININLSSGTVASSLMTIRPTKTYYKYLFYFLLSSVTTAQTEIFTNGTCAANLSATNVGRYIYVFPDSIEQKGISDYLDKKCKLIDSAINKKQSIIDMLTGYKKSLIYEAVTGKMEV